MNQPERHAEGGEAGYRWRRLVPVAILLAGLVAFFAFDLDRYVTFESLRERHEWLTRLVAEHGLAAALGFLALYAAVVAFSIPAGLFLSLAGGYLFGEWLGTLYCVVGATIGATVLFCVARSALGEPLRERAGPWLRRLEAGFSENALSYLLVLRLVVVFPFWVVNLVPAFLGVPLRTYVAGTFLGIIPGAFVFNLAGAGLGSIFESGAHFTKMTVLTPEVVAAFVGLAVLALLPVAYRRWKARRARATRGGDRIV